MRSESDEEIHTLMNSSEYKVMQKEMFSTIRVSFPEYEDTLVPMDAFLRRMASIIDPRFSNSINSPEGHELYSDYLNFCAGNKVYALHSNLITKLNSTHIKSIPSEFLRLPFKTITLRPPKDVISFKAFNDITYNGEEVIISEIPALTSGKGIALKILVRNAPYNCFFTIVLEKDEVHECVDDTLEIINRNSNRRRVETNQKIEEIKQSPNISDKVKAGYLEVLEANIEFTTEHKTQVRVLFEFIMKCILYINGANADIYWYDENEYLQAKITKAKSPKKIKKLKAMAEKSGVYRVGHRITISREEREMYENIKSGKWEVTSKFIVQGHYRSQPYGEGRQKRKIIFIEPFYKGTSFTEIINRDHIVK